MYYDVPEGLGLRKIADGQMQATQPAGGMPAFIQKHGRNILRGLAGGLLGHEIAHGYGVQQMSNRNRNGSVKNAPVIPRRPNIPAPVGGAAPANQRPTGYGVGVGDAPSAWTRKVKASVGGLADHANAPVGSQHNMYHEGQHSINPPFTQRFIDSGRGWSK